MPELFGIFNSEGLNTEHRLSIDRMRDSFTSFDYINVLEKETPYFHLTIIQNNKSENNYFNISSNDELVSGWVGTPEIFKNNFNQNSAYDILINKNYSSLDSAQSPYCAAISSTKRPCACLITDNFGHHPIYYINHNKTIIFSTKLPPLLHTKFTSWVLNKSAILEFFTYEHVLNDKTFIDKINLIPPNTILHLENNNIYETNHDDKLGQNNELTTTKYEIAETIYDRLSSSISNACKHSSNTAITLSGGLDSRAILGCALENTNSLSAYTFGTNYSRDVKSASKLAKIAEIPHEIIPIDGSYLNTWLNYGLHITGGMVNCIHYQILSLANTLSSNTDLVLDGLGGDMLTGAHIKRSMIAARTNINSIDILYKLRASAWASRSEHNEIFNTDFLHEAENPKDTLSQYYNNFNSNNFWRGSHEFDIKERQRRFIQHGPHLLRSFAPVCTPFYDADLIKYMLNVNVKHLIDQNSYRYMHKNHLKYLANVPDAERGIPLTCPASIRFGKRLVDFGVKKIYRLNNRKIDIRHDKPTNYPDWFRNELRELVHDNILCNMHLDSYIKKSTAERLINEHMEYKADHTIKIGILLTFGSWLQSIKDI